MIKIKGLHKRFGKQEVLSNLNLDINDTGGIYAVLGPNGSGKTTLIKSILGMVVPNKGQIEVMRTDVYHGWKYREKISYLPQIANFPSNLKVSELFRMIKDLRGSQADESTLISTFDLEQYLDKRLVNLSGGTKQKVNIALTFMFDSPLIILDEPTTGLDPLSHLHLKKLIAQEKANHKTFLVTSHILSFVEEVSDYIIYLLEGKIYFMGTIEQLLKKSGQTDFERAIASISMKEHHV